jgi:hypothetical protein
LGIGNQCGGVQLQGVKLGHVQQQKFDVRMGKERLEPVVKSVRRVPMPITKSACGASWLAAIPPVTPNPPS